MALDIVITDIPITREWSDPQLPKNSSMEREALPALVPPLASSVQQVVSDGEFFGESMTKKNGKSARRTKRKVGEPKNFQRRKQWQRSNLSTVPVLNNNDKRNGNLAGILSSRTSQAIISTGVRVSISPKSSRVPLHLRTNSANQHSKEMIPPLPKSHIKGNGQRMPRLKQIQRQNQRTSTTSKPNLTDKESTTTGRAHKPVKSSASTESIAVRQRQVQRNSKSAPAKCGPRANQFTKRERNTIGNRVSNVRDSNALLNRSRKSEYWLKKAMKERLRQEIYAKNRLMKFVEERRWKILEMSDLDTAVDDGSFAV